MPNALVCLLFTIGVLLIPHNLHGQGSPDATVVVNGSVNMAGTEFSASSVESCISGIQDPEWLFEFNIPSNLVPTCSVVES